MAKLWRIVQVLLWPVRLFGLGTDAHLVWTHREQIVAVASALSGAIATTIFAIAQRYPSWVVPLFALLAFLFVLVVAGWGVKGVRYLSYLSNRRSAPEQSGHDRGTTIIELIENAQIVQSPETEVQERWRSEDELRKYRDRMQEWLYDETRPLAADPSRRQRASSETLWVLERLGPKQKRSVLEFLQVRGLIRAHHGVGFLSGADFSDAELANINLVYTDLAGVNFSGADLSGAQFVTFGGYGGVANTPAGMSRLDRVDLRSAILRDAKLTSCVLAGAKFDGADLEGADLRGVDLRITEGLTQEQINKAYGGLDGQDEPRDTLLPNHLSRPESWDKPLSEQKKGRGH